MDHFNRQLTDQSLASVYVERIVAGFGLNQLIGLNQLFNPKRLNEVSQKYGAEFKQPFVLVTMLKHPEDSSPYNLEVKGLDSQRHILTVIKTVQQYNDSHDDKIFYVVYNTDTGDVISASHSQEPWWPWAEGKLSRGY